jgi:hypothetical protein
MIQSNSMPTHDRLAVARNYGLKSQALHDKLSYHPHAKCAHDRKYILQSLDLSELCGRALLTPRGTIPTSSRLEEWCLAA